jgi:phosphoglucomutase
MLKKLTVISYDYESVSSEGANKMMTHLRGRIAELKKGDKLGDFETPLEYADEFEYKDPVDGSISSNQGLRFVFEDGSRIIIRLSGTGSVGATVRLYLEKYEPNVDNHAKETLVCFSKCSS